MIASAAMNLHAHLILAKCQRLFARAWHGFYWHDFVVIQVKIERLQTARLIELTPHTIFAFDFI
ncbi:hypothetical protein BTA15_15895 [Vibrio parahaemolyticus]|nr:hypothetical protein BTA15_15895 [Vibrio parahaemolyticus]